MKMINSDGTVVNVQRWAIKTMRRRGFRPLSEIECEETRVAELPERDGPVPAADDPGPDEAETE